MMVKKEGLKDNLHIDSESLLTLDGKIRSKSLLSRSHILLPCVAIMLHLIEVQV